MARCTKPKLEPRWLNQIGEMGISTQHLFDVTSSHANVYVGSVWLFGAGARARF